MNQTTRDLTSKEKHAIRKLVTTTCASSSQVPHQSLHCSSSSHKVDDYVGAL